MKQQGNYIQKSIKQELIKKISQTKIKIIQKLEFTFKERVAI
jgi:hypothetical protein